MPATPILAPGRVLLIGGNSGTGKSVIAAQLGRRLGLPWLQVDDFRLALARVASPDRLPAVQAIASPDLWRRPAEAVLDLLIAVGREVGEALAIVIANHVATAAPVILEGDALLPSLAARPDFAGLPICPGQVRAVFLVEPDEAALLAQMRARGRGFAALSPAEQGNQARASWLFGRWLAAEAARLGLPVVPPEPFKSLAERIMAAVNWNARQDDADD